jgi:hypothetical protein
MLLSQLQVRDRAEARQRVAQLEERQLLSADAS